MKRWQIIPLLLVFVALSALVTVTPARADDPTPTPTFTPTPSGASIIWAAGTVTVSSDLANALASRLASDPPEGVTTSVYALTHISGASTSWAVSLLNLEDVSAPYDEWNAETNGGWAGTLECTGSDPYWSCDYLSVSSSGGSSGMLFPWQGGYFAIYGVRGVHRDTPSIISGSYAVDFVGDSSSSIMPDTVVAVADGTISWVCSDGVSMAIRVDGGPVPVAYFHFETGQVFNEGDTVQQGQVLGQLKHGAFTGPAGGCGWGSQSPTEYHLHFVFLPTSTGYLEIGEAVLDLNTGSFLANGNTYPPLSLLPNNGGSSIVDPDTDTDGSSTASGGVHIWDGIVDAAVKLGANAILEIMPAHDPRITYFISTGKAIALIVIDTYKFVFGGGAMPVSQLMWIFISLIISMETILWVLDKAVVLGKSVLNIVKLAKYFI